jgi:HEAT repeat protein
LLLDHLPSEHDADVLASIATAFGHLRDPRSIPGLHGLRDHDNQRVRFGVVFGLSGVDDDLAVQTLIELSADEDAHVRDCAAFGLATQIDRDDHVLRSALIARLDDPDDTTRDEALRGLATRGDSRAIPQLLHELGGAAAREDPGTLQEALLVLASRTADGRLCAHVDAMEQEWLRDCADDALPTALQSAIEACRHAERRGR